MCIFDLKSGYHHVNIHDKSHTYLGFSWAGKYYMFIVSPFRLSTACYVFTKLMRPLVSLWRGRGIRCVLYIDDGIIMAQGENEATTVGRYIKELLEAARLVVNEEKSHWEPSQETEWLGFTLDTSSGCIRIPQDQLERLRTSRESVEKAYSISARQH